MAFARIQLPPSVKRGDAVEVRVSIRHPMETGFRVDDDGRTIARNTLKSLTCRYGDREVLRASLGSGIAANPYLRFFVTGRASGELVFDWVDDEGKTGSERVQLVVSG